MISDTKSRAASPGAVILPPSGNLFDDTGFAADTARVPPAMDVAIDDWDELMSAVETRLRLTVSERLANELELPDSGSADRIRATVLECLSALDQLHTTLKHELGRRREVDQEVFDARTALASMPDAPAGARTGESRARYRSLHDDLTLLPNRACFRERVDLALNQTEPKRRMLAMLYLDLDGFKPINDAHGHSAGDALLRIVAARLIRAVRADDMVGRLGGDEFACLVGNWLTREQLRQMACKLFNAISAPLTIGALSFSVYPSIGIAMCPDDGTTTDDLIKNADAAMYRAKRLQSGFAFFDQQAGV